MKEEKKEITRLKKDFIDLKQEFDVTISEINNAIKQVADYVRINPEQTCIQEMKRDISNLKKKYNILHDIIEKKIYIIKKR